MKESTLSIDRTISKEELLSLIKAGVCASNCRNNELWEFIIVNDREQLDKVANLLPYAASLHDSPAAILVCADKKKAGLEHQNDFWAQDCSAATDKILCAAENLGLKADWTAIHPVEKRVNAMKDAFSLPDNVVPLNLIPVNTKNGDNENRDMDFNDIHWNSWK